MLEVPVMQQIKNPLRIAHVLPWSEIGGTELATLRIANAVEGEKFSSVAFCQPQASPVRELFEANGFETATYGNAHFSYLHPKPFWRQTLQLAREFRRRKIDLIHLADWQAAQYVALAAKLAFCPIISHVRNRHAEEIGRDRHFLRAVKKFVFVSRDTWKSFAYPVPEQRGMVLYDGIDIPAPSELSITDIASEVRRELGFPADVKIIGMVARVATQKDFITLIKAAQHVLRADPKVRFLVVGDHTHAEENRNHYEKIVSLFEAESILDHFTFTGFRTDVDRIIQAMDIFVLCTHFEGLPLVLIEAMALGKPVVATAVDGIPEIVSDGETGLLHSHEDDKQLAEQLLSLLNNKERSNQLGEAGRSRVKTEFSREVFAANIAKLYSDMLGEKDPKVPSKEHRSNVNLF